MRRILVVDDEARMRRALTIYLEARGYEVDPFGDAETALSRSWPSPHVAAIVDLGLPGIDGIEVVRRCGIAARCRSSCSPAGTRTSQKIVALDAGADDYVTKPFSMGELLARLRAALRRAEPGRRSIAGRRDPGLLHRSRGEARHERRRSRDQADADAVAARRDPGAQPRPARQPAPAARRGVGTELRAAQATTCASSGAAPAASSSPTPPIRATSSPSRVMGVRFLPSGRSRRLAHPVRFGRSSARLSSSTLTAGSPRMPNARSSVCFSIERQHGRRRQPASRSRRVAPGASRWRP